MTKNPTLFWGLIASMWIGNLMLVLLNLPLIGIWVRLLKIPYRWLYPSILMFACLGNYSLNNSSTEIYVVAGLSLLGYVFIKLGCEPAPLILGFVLGPLVEENLRRALVLSRGDPTVFFTRPISLSFLLATLAMIILMGVQAMRQKREETSDTAKRT
jgi:TctA family transporter